SSGRRVAGTREFSCRSPFDTFVLRSIGAQEALAPAKPSRAACSSRSSSFKPEVAFQLALVLDSALVSRAHEGVKLQLLVEALGKGASEIDHDFALASRAQIDLI